MGTSRKLSKERQELQTRIARLRRRLDRRAGQLIDQSLLIGSWRNYVERHPGRSLLAAAGVGMVASFLVTGYHASGRFGEKLYEAATGTAWGQMWPELKAFIMAAGERGESPDA